MTVFNCQCVIWFLALNLSLCVIVHAGLIHRPTLYDELLAAIDSNGLSNSDYESGDREERHQANFYQTLPSSYLSDDNTIQQMINRHKNGKRSKLNLHTNLNLPRYLRHAD